MKVHIHFDALLNGAAVLVEELKATKPKENVSMAVYDTFPRKILDLTENLDLLNTAIAGESPGGFTGIGRGMRVGLDSILNDPNARNLALKSIVVMTDGRQNRGVNPVVVARECRDANVVVHTITFSGGANQNLMKQVADITGGTHLHATTNDQLVEAFAAIARQLQVLLIE